MKTHLRWRSAPALVLLALAGALAVDLVVETGCSSTSGTGGAGGNDGGVNPGLSVPDCVSYCTEVMANCTGMDAQYPSLAACVAVCPTFPVGAITDTSSDSLGCRLYHGGTPALMNPGTHCPHAGPTGFPLCGSDKCAAFCQTAIRVCSSDWPDPAACQAKCATLTDNGSPFNDGQTSGNSLNCRFNALTAAAAAAAASETAAAAKHCGDTLPASTQCQ